MKDEKDEGEDNSENKNGEVEGSESRNSKMEEENVDSANQ
jgi:hypothetical protein